jgi:hypothetical protein
MFLRNVRLSPNIKILGQKINDESVVGILLLVKERVGFCFVTREQI